MSVPCSPAPFPRQARRTFLLLAAANSCAAYSETSTSVHTAMSLHPPFADDSSCAPDTRPHALKSALVFYRATDCITMKYTQKMRTMQLWGHAESYCDTRSLGIGRQGQRACRQCCKGRGPARSHGGQCIAGPHVPHRADAHMMTQLRCSLALGRGTITDLVCGGGGRQRCFGEELPLLAGCQSHSLLAVRPRTSFVGCCCQEEEQNILLQLACRRNRNSPGNS